MRNPSAALLLLLAPGLAFVPIVPFVSTKAPARSQHAPLVVLEMKKPSSDAEPKTTGSRFQSLLNRLDTLQAAGLCEDKDNLPLVSRGGGFRRFMILMAVGMAYKWYRARFINKIPFWEKQPQWNMVVANKEQEEQLRAYTCQNCGSTIFIARNREWFFEGGTGIGGLGCYACGEKGKENFVMDRDRIVDDVGDDDDYFDYERPLDFVSAAERKKLLKETAGDEEAANKMLTDAATEATGGPAPAAPPMFGISQEEAQRLKDDKDGGGPPASEPKASAPAPKDSAPAPAPKSISPPTPKASAPAPKAIIPPAPPASAGRPAFPSPPATPAADAGRPAFPSPPAPTPPPKKAAPKKVDPGDDMDVLGI